MDSAKEIRINDQLSTQQTFQVEAFDITKRFTQPQKPNYYLGVIYFSKGNGFHYLDTRAYKITPPNFNHKL